MKKEQPRERIREEMQERPARSRNTSSFAASTRKKQPGQQDRQEVFHTPSRPRAKVHALSVRHRQGEIRRHAGKNAAEGISFRL